MNELALQKLIVDAVNGAGGFAFKSNNRFLIGVADLLIKLPNRDVKGFATQQLMRYPPAGFLEVKQRDAWPRDEIFALDVTRQQAVFLREASAAGMPTGVASFIQRERDILLAVYPWSEFKYSETHLVAVGRSQHHSIGKGKERGNNILTHLYNWMREWREAG